MASPDDLWLLRLAALSRLPGRAVDVEPHCFDLLVGDVLAIAHAEPLHHALRRQILRFGDGENQAEAYRIESVLERSAAQFAGIAFAPHIRVQGVQKLGFAEFLEAPQAAMADQATLTAVLAPQEQP